MIESRTGLVIFSGYDDPFDGRIVVIDGISRKIRSTSKFVRLTPRFLFNFQSIVDVIENPMKTISHTSDQS